MAKKIRVGIIFGGRSAEHEVSLQSARNIYKALDRSKYEPVLIGITKTGRWQFNKTSKVLESGKQHGLLSLPDTNNAGALIPQGEEISQLDVVFPVLHGPYGEDGTVQGLLKLAGVAFVGSDVLGSAVGMDKDVSKRLLKEARIPVVNVVVVG